MPHYYKVTWNGTTLFKGIPSRQAAEAKAEKWQGERYKRGLLKHGDKGDYIEVKRDVDTEREFDDRYDVFKRGGRQRIIKEQYIP